MANSALDYCPSTYNDCTADMPDLVQAACLGVGVDLIDAILITPPDAPGFTTQDYASASALGTAIAARLKQTGTYTGLTGYALNSAIRKWNVYDGTKPFVEPTLVTARPGLQFAKRSQKTIEGVDYDNSIVNHTFHQTMNCYKTARIWYTAGGFLYGGKEGILVSFNSWHGIIDSGDRPTEGWTWRLSYLALRTEDKCVRPGVI